MTEIAVDKVMTFKKTKNSDKGRSLWQDALHRLLKNKMAVIGFSYLVFQTLVAVFAPFIAPHDYSSINLMYGAQPPSFEHFFGTDMLGRDLFTRVIYGSRISLMVGVLATSVSIIVGVFYGAISGYIGGRLDNLMMRFVEVLYALPFMFFVIILMVFFGRDIYLLFIALGLIQWLTMARVVRGQVISLKNKEYIDAARTMGVSDLKIITKHIIPNVIGPITILATLTVPGVILEEAFLSFLGLGVQEPMSSWGTLISDGANAVESYPWMLIYPCITLMLTLLALNFFGDGLRDALDPKSSKD